MSSEEVKEIKKALEDNANYEHYNKLGYIDGYKCKTVAFADILTLINEFESENERLKILLAQANAGIVNCSGCKLVEINAVRAFAEKLKEICVSKRKFIDIDDEEEYYFDGAVTITEIDELLKEFEK